MLESFLPLVEEIVGLNLNDVFDEPKLLLVVVDFIVLGGWIFLELMLFCENLKPSLAKAGLGFGLVPFIAMFSWLYWTIDLLWGLVLRLHFRFSRFYL